MFKALHIKNFRCHKNVRATGLSRLNIVVGNNAVGKTALLEALFLCSGSNPELALRIQAFRGDPGLEISTQPSAYKSMWQHLFFGFDDSQKIDIALGTGETVNRGLEITYIPSQGALLQSSVGDSGTQSVPIPITFTWTSPSGKSETVSPEFSNNALKFPTAVSIDVLPGVYLSSARLPSSDDSAAWFSDLSISNAEGPFIDLIRSVFPFISDLSLQFIAGRSILHASVVGLSHKIPVTLVSMGIVKLLGILLGIVKMKGGIVLIDEIESGFHHSILKSVWQLIDRSAKDNGVQVFATTHSGECVDAALSAVGSPKDDICFLRLTRKNGNTALKTFNGIAIRSAIEEDVEVR